MANTGSAGSAPDPAQLWRQWVAVLLSTWLADVGTAVGPEAAIAQWLQMSRAPHAPGAPGGVSPADVAAHLRQWYAATGEAWSRAADELVSSETFIADMSHLLDSYTAQVRAQRRASEAYLRQMQVPTRADIARVAKLVIALEDKVDRLDERIEAPSDTAAQPASTVHADELAELRSRLTRVEDKLDRVLDALEHTAPHEQPAANVRRPTAAARQSAATSTRTGGAATARRPRATGAGRRKAAGGAGPTNE